MVGLHLLQLLFSLVDVCVLLLGLVEGLPRMVLLYMDRDVQGFNLVSWMVQLCQSLRRYINVLKVLYYDLILCLLIWNYHWSLVLVLIDRCWSFDSAFAICLLSGVYDLDVNRYRH